MESEYLKPSLGTQCPSGTPFLFPKAQIPPRADPQGIIHSMALSPRAAGTICGCSSQPKLPDLECWDFVHARRRDSPSLQHMECLCKDTSNMLWLRCPAQPSDAPHQSLSAPSLSHHFPVIPQFAQNGCPVSWKMQNSH